MDAHHERSGSKFMEDSAPDALNKYEGLISYLILKIDLENSPKRDHGF